MTELTDGSSYDDKTNTELATDLRHYALYLAGDSAAVNVISAMRAAANRLDGTGQASEFERGVRVGISTHDMYFRDENEFAMYEGATERVLSESANYALAECLRAEERGDAHWDFGFSDRTAPEPNDTGRSDR